MKNAKEYAESEALYFPQHWDEQTIKLVKFMLIESFNTGVINGRGLALHYSIDQLKGVIKAMEHHIKISGFNE